MNKKSTSVWEGFKKTLSDLKEQWHMFRELWKTAKPDCRGPLIEELLFNPDALRRRHHNELAFKRQMEGRWRQ